MTDEEWRLLKARLLAGAIERADVPFRLHHPPGRPAYWPAIPVPVAELPDFHAGPMEAEMLWSVRRPCPTCYADQIRMDLMEGPPPRAVPRIIVALKPQTYAYSVADGRREVHERVTIYVGQCPGCLTVWHARGR